MTRRRSLVSRLALTALLATGLACSRDDSAGAPAGDPTSATEAPAPEAADPGSASEAPSAPAPTANAEPAAPAPFDLAAVPLSTATLPEFPYLDWPESVPAEERSVARQSELDGYTLIAGEGLLGVEGRLEQRVFSIPSGQSQLAIRRAYEDRIAALGGVRVDRLRPTTDSASISARVESLFEEGQDPAKRLDLQRYDEGSYEYGAYVVRTAEKTIWFVLQSSQYSVVVTTIEAKAADAPPAA